jgi:pimeloyl-ACP methyl ester carboxylesterase
MAVTEPIAYVPEVPSTSKALREFEFHRKTSELGLPLLSWVEAGTIAVFGCACGVAHGTLLLLSPFFLIAPLCAICTAVVLVVVLWCGIKLQKQQHLLLSEKGLATDSSHFTSVPGVRGQNVVVHHIGCVATAPHEREVVVCHFSHGFAANCLTWEPFFPAFVRALHGASTSSCTNRLVLVAHDRPGFGLTSRPDEVDGYSEASNVCLGLQIIQHEALHHGGTCPTEAMVAPTYTSSHSGDALPHSMLLCGHSLGCVQAVRMALAARRTPRALVLLAPALMPCPSASVPAWVLRLLAPITLGTSLVCLLARKCILPMASPLLRSSSTVIRLLLFCCLHSGLFWRCMLERAYADKTKLQQSMEFRYRWVTRVRGADTGTMRYLVALVRQQLYNLWPCSDSSNNRWPSKGDEWPFGASARAPMEADDALWRQLSKLGIPILIVHGRQDRVIPPLNSRRLAACMPSANLLVLENCGHNIHEECPDELEVAIASFAVRCGVRVGAASCS